MDNDQTEITSLRAFISYSWTSEDHVKRVVDLATRLVSDGVNVILDQWDLKEGQDKNAFMEQMVTDATVTKVIVVSDNRYSEKANKREGGVGTESQIISQEVYNRVEQQKFIPVFVEVDKDGNAILPVFLKARFAINFSSDSLWTENYEQLLRCIYDRPALQKPKLGTPPQYLFKEATAFTPNRIYLERFKRSLLEEKSTYLPLARTYLERFDAGLEAFRISPPPNKIDEEFDRTFHEMLLARDELLEFYKEAFSFKNDSELFDVVIKHLERSLSFNYRTEKLDRYHDEWFENYQLFNYESFVYLVAILIEFKRDTLIDALLSTKFYSLAHARESGGQLATFTTFWTYSEIYNRRNKTQNLRRISVLADVLKQRATIEYIPFIDFIQAEIVLALRSYRDGKEWYPHSAIYAGRTLALPLFTRAVNRADFVRLLSVLGFDSKESLKSMLDNGMDRNGGLARLIPPHAGHSFKDMINYQGLFEN